MSDMFVLHVFLSENYVWSGAQSKSVKFFLGFPLTWWLHRCPSSCWHDTCWGPGEERSCLLKVPWCWGLHQPQEGGWLSSDCSPWKPPGEGWIHFCSWHLGHRGRVHLGDKTLLPQSWLNRNSEGWCQERSSGCLPGQPTSPLIIDTTCKETGREIFREPCHVQI